MNPGWLQAAHELRDLTQGTTIFLAEKLMNAPEIARRPRARAALLQQCVELMTDPKPDETLMTTAKAPLPGLPDLWAGTPVSPLEKWRQIERASALWPAPVQRCARHLGVGSGKLPRWAQIERFCASFGFAAIPVRGYVGAPVYSFMISRKLVPVCTNWVLRYQGQPYYYAPTDTLHDLGHALAMVMPDYRELLTAFAVAALGSGRKIISRTVDMYYGRLFEFSYVRDDKGRVELIGAGSMIFETIRVRGGKLEPCVTDSRALRHQSFEYRPFRSRQEWRGRARGFVERLKGMSG